MTVAECIKIARKKAGMTQEELGRKLGVSGAMIAQYETGRRHPKMETKEDISLALGMPYRQVFPSSTTPDELESMAGDVLLFGKYSPMYNIYNDGNEDDNALKESVGQVKRILETFEAMNLDGQQKVADYAEDILPRYKKAPHQPQESTLDSTEGTDTTPPQGGSEGHLNGE